MNIELLNVRLCLITAFYALGDVLAALADQGDTVAERWWDRLPSLPPVTRISDVADALVLARRMLIAFEGHEAELEVVAFSRAIWNFSQQPSLGEPPMRTFKPAIAACPQSDGSYVVYFRRT